jgi:hypothetical protein
MKLCNLLLVALFFTAVPCLAKRPALTDNERLIGELMLSHDHSKLERALKMIYYELDNAPSKFRPRWLSLAGLCELEIAAGERPSARAEQRCKRGFELLLQAAHAGDANAAMSLSDMYRYGEPPVTQDIAKAKYWNDRALTGRRGK